MTNVGTWKKEDLATDQEKQESETRTNDIIAILDQHKDSQTNQIDYLKLIAMLIADEQ